MFTNKNVNMFLTESLDKGVEDSGIVEKMYYHLTCKVLSLF